MIWDGNDLLAQVEDSGNLIHFYNRGATLVKQREKEGVPQPYPHQYLHLDSQGTVVCRSDPSGGSSSGVIDPNPWGQVSGSTGLGWLGDPGYFYETGLQRDLYYVRARWYVAGGPGWLSKDPLGLGGGDLNLYRYVGNRPLVATDPSGYTELALPVTGGIAGAAGGLTSGTVLTLGGVTAPLWVWAAAAAAVGVALWCLFSPGCRAAVANLVEEVIREVQNTIRQPYPQTPVLPTWDPVVPPCQPPLQVTPPNPRRNRWHCTAKCTLEGKLPECNGFIHGTGSGPSEEEACRAAKRDATQRAPLGCYARHCRCPSCVRI
jgi:RHS repeat-associated protein